MSDVRTEAELTRLAATLGAAREDVDVFAPAGPEAVRRLTEQVSDALLEEGAPAFRRVAALADRLPAGLAATLSQKVLGPVLSARAAAALPAEKAAELAPRFPAAFLAAVAVSIDPRHVAELLGRIEPGLAVPVATELEATGEVIAMGLLMAQLSSTSLRAAADALEDATILRAGLFVEDRARLAEVVAGFSDERLHGLADTAERDGLQPQLDDLIGRLDGVQGERVAALRAARSTP